MFPMIFDHRILTSLPLPGEERTDVVAQVLRELLVHRVLPHFRTRRGTDAYRLSQLQSRISIARLDDEKAQIRIVSLTTSEKEGWRILIHERIFDFFSFVLSSDPEAGWSERTQEERKMLAFAELLLRHSVEHMLYPERGENGVIGSDAEFAMDRRQADPTFYRAVRDSLSDEMNGIAGRNYLALLDAAESGLPLQGCIETIIEEATHALADLPAPLFAEVLVLLDAEIHSRVLSECYRRHMSTGFTLVQRSHYLQKVFRLLALVIDRRPAEATDVLNTFKDKWGLIGLFHELDIPESDADRRSPQELIEALGSALRSHFEAETSMTAAPVPVPEPLQKRQPAAPAQKSLKDRIEEARGNPFFPQRVIELIDRNKLNVIGHSGSKYTELIETLLAIPWGRIQRIGVTPREFEEGLERSHYGLQGPKELLCDFFTNLISRYGDFDEARAATWRRTGSAFLLVGPPGVGKTSLAISVAQNLGIPYHKLSLGGMRDETDIRGHGFTYEGSKPGAIVQGLIKMEAMNGMFILDEADKTEKFAISTLLEILDPEQNHLFHDKYTQTTVDIDLSNCHFFLTGNTLEGVPPVVINRCEVIFLDRYSVEEKIAIARRHLLQRVREQYKIPEDLIYFHPDEEEDILRFMIRHYTCEAGVRELERILRTLFLRLQRKELLTGKESSVRITREKVKTYLREPARPRRINDWDGIGEMLALGVDLERGVGSVIPIQATRIGLESGPGASRRGYLSILHATGNIEKVMDESRKVATTGVFSRAEALGIDRATEERPVHLHFMGGSTRKDGPSAGGAIGLALASLLSERRLRRDVAMTGEIDTRGRITSVGGLDVKIETACNAGCKTVVIPRENLHGEGGIERLPDALKKELQILTFEEWRGEHEPFDYQRHLLQVVAVEDIVQAARVAMIDEKELNEIESQFEAYAREVAEALRSAPSRSRLNCQVFQVKMVEELECRALETRSREDLMPEPFHTLPSHPHMARLVLALPEIESGLRSRLKEIAGPVSLSPFIPKDQRLMPCLKEWLTTLRLGSSRPVRLAVVAPYYLLMRDGIVDGHDLLDGDVESLRFFANNYTVQGIKVKSCKALLDHVYSTLDLLDDPLFSDCPFLGRIEHVNVIDLSFIPERYRLDESRAQDLLMASLARWLTVVTRALKD